MPIISFKDNRENNWKWNAKTKNKQTHKIIKKKKKEAEQGGWKL